MSWLTNDSSVLSRVALRIRKSTSVLRLRSRSPIAEDVGSDGVPVDVVVVDGPMRLDYDVLHIIMKATKSEDLDLLPIMHTCRTLYQLGVPLLLQNIHYTYITRRYLLYYHLFLSDPSRFTHVISLRCSMNIPRADIRELNLFSDFLHYSTRLRDLDIMYHPSRTPEYRTLEQVPALPKLRRLHLRNYPSHFLVKLLLSITVPLITLGIHRESPRFELEIDSSPLNFAPLAAPFQASLTSLEIKACTDIVVPLSASATFPNVRELRWRSANVVHASTLAALFPGLQELDVSFALLTAPGMVTARTRQHMLDGRPQWDALQRVVGAYHHLWALGLCCTVSDLTLVVHDRQGDEPRTELAEAVMRSLHPSQLALILAAGSPALQHSSLASFVHADLRELMLDITLPDPTSLESTVAALPSFLERHVSQRTTACGWDLRRLRMRFETTDRLYGRNLWSINCTQVNWATLAWIVFTTMPSVAEVSFDVTDYASFTWLRDECEGEPVSTSLFLKTGGPGNSKSAESSPPGTKRVLHQSLYSIFS